MRPTLRFIASMLTVSAVSVGAQPTPRPDSSWQNVRMAMARFVVSGTAPSVSVAVAIDGRIVFAEAAGLADRERQRRATTSTPYSIASSTKPITATAVMRLVDRGKLQLDDPADRYLGRTHVRSWDGSDSDVTVRQLLSHTAGLPEHLDFYYAGEPERRPPADTTISRYAVTGFTPGTVYQYSNLGYGILASVVSRVTKRSFADAMDSLVFAPAAMRHSALRRTVAPRNAATRYDAQGRALADYAFLDDDGASSAYASATDLAKFGILHLAHSVPRGDSLLREASRSVMQQRATPVTGTGYGLGWELGIERGTPVVLHSGGMPGVRARLTLIPSQRAVIVILVNGEVWSSDLYEMLLTHIGLAASAPGAPSLTAAGTDSSGALRLAPQARLLGQWRGSVRTYEGTAPFTLAVLDSAHARFSLGGTTDAAVSELTFADGFVYGFIEGDLPSADARRRPRKLWFQLRPQRHGADDELEGFIYAESTGDAAPHITLGSPARLTRRQ